MSKVLGRSVLRGGSLSRSQVDERRNGFLSSGSLGSTQGGTGGPPPVATFFFLLETSDKMLLETGDRMLKEDSP